MEATKYNGILNYFVNIFGPDNIEYSLHDGKLEITGNTPLYVPPLVEAASRLNGETVEFEAELHRYALGEKGFKEYLSQIDKTDIVSLSDKIMDTKQKMEKIRESEKEALIKKYDNIASKTRAQLTDINISIASSIDDRIKNEMPDILKKDKNYILYEEQLSKDTKEFHDMLNEIQKTLINTDGITIQMDNISYDEDDNFDDLYSLENAYADMHAKINTTKTSSAGLDAIANHSLMKGGFGTDISCIKFSLDGFSITCENPPYKDENKTYKIIIDDLDDFNKKKIDAVVNKFFFGSSGR